MGRPDGSWIGTPSQAPLSRTRPAGGGWRYAACAAARPIGRPASRRSLGQEKIQRPAAVGRALFRVQPHVVRQLLDIDERSNGVFDQRNLIRRAGLGEEQQAAERLEFVADAEAGHEEPRLRASERLHGGPFDERVVHEERPVAREQEIAHEGLEHTVGVEQDVRTWRDLQASGIGGKRLRALDAALDLAVERSRQLVAVRAQALVAQADQRRRQPDQSPRALPLMPGAVRLPRRTVGAALRAIR